MLRRYRHLVFAFAIAAWGVACASPTRAVSSARAVPGPVLIGPVLYVGDAGGETLDESPLTPAPNGRDAMEISVTLRTEQSSYSSSTTHYSSNYRQMTNAENALAFSLLRATSSIFAWGTNYTPQDVIRMDKLRLTIARLKQQGFGTGKEIRGMTLIVHGAKLLRGPPADSAPADDGGSEATH